MHIYNLRSYNEPGQSTQGHAMPLTASGMYSPAVRKVIGLLSLTTR